LISTRWIARIIYVPNRLLGAFILILAFVGVFSIRNSFTDCMFAAGFGFLGYILRRLDWPLVPVVLGLVLGQIMIDKLTAGSSQIKTVFDLVNRPVSGTLFVVILCVLAFTFITSLRQRRFEH
ncbi:MAG: tripartite tricarboxylate transporter permease, partial [Pseudomonadota bacterium]